MKFRIGRWTAPRVSPLAGVVAAGLVVAATVAAGYPAHRVQLVPGSAWLASYPPGLVTLLDGATADASGFTVAPSTVGSLHVGADGDQLQVAQIGLTAFVADATSGAVTRIDGATLATTTRSDLGAGVRVWADDTHVYVIEPQRNQIALLDPTTLQTVRTDPAHATDGVLDSSGRLWSIDQDAGAVLSFDGDGVHREAAVPHPGSSLLVTAAGQPVLVDTTARTVRSVSTGGSLGPAIALEATAADLATPQIAGSAVDHRVYAALSSSATLLATDLSGGRSWQVTVGNPGDALGPPIESAALVYVPDYSRHTVAVVDPDLRTVSQSRPIPGLGAGYQFTPYPSAAAVYYNNPDGTQAGLINSTATYLAAVGKYDRADPSKGDLRDAGVVPATTKPKSNPVTAHKSTPPSTQPSNSSSAPPSEPPSSGGPGSGGGANGGGLSGGGPTEPSGGGGTPTGGGPGHSSPPPPVSVHVVESGTRVEDCQSVTFSLVPADAVRSATWDFADNTGNVFGTHPTHKYTKSRDLPYSPLVDVTLKSGVHEHPPVGRVTVVACGSRGLHIDFTGNGSGTLTDTPPGIQCTDKAGTQTGSCEAPYAPGSKITLTANTDHSTITGWAGCSTGITGPVRGPLPNTCTLTMPDADTTVTLDLAADPTYTLTVTVAGSGTGTVTGKGNGNGLNCTGTGDGTAPDQDSGTCSVPLYAGDTVDLSENPQTNTSFVGWSGGCTADPCSFSMPAANTSVTASFALAMTLVINVTGGNQTRRCLQSSSPVQGGGRPICTKYEYYETPNIVHVPGQSDCLATVTGNSTSGYLFGQHMCTYSLPQNQSVILTASSSQSPPPFWGGDCSASGTGSQCTVTMSTTVTVDYG